MIKVAIVEDDKSSGDILIGHLNRYAAEHDRAMDISYYDTAVKLLENYSGNFDMIFMDIEMPYMDGMTGVKKLRETDKDVLVFFVTNLAQFAVSGYEVNAFDFIVKPVVYFNFALKLNRAFKCLDNACKREFWIFTRQGKKMISAKNLKYVEIMRHTLIFHTEDETASATGTMKNVQQKLSGLPFVLCNQCYLVNLRYVTEVRDEQVYIGGESLKISSPKRKEFLRELNNFLAAKGNSK